MKYKDYEVEANYKATKKDVEEVINNIDTTEEEQTYINAKYVYEVNTGGYIMEVKVGQKRIFKVDNIKFEVVKVNGSNVTIKELTGCQITRIVRLATVEEYSSLI